MVNLYETRFKLLSTLVDRPTDEYPVDNMYARSPPNILSVYLKKTIKILSISRKSV